MLVLSRFEDERVRIGDDVIVTVVEVKGRKVKLGFEAPADISVHREEVWQKIKSESPETD